MSILAYLKSQKQAVRVGKTARKSEPMPVGITILSIFVTFVIFAILAVIGVAVLAL